MSSGKKRKISTLGSQVTSIISVTLVLLVVGILVLIGLIASKLSETLRENIELTVKMDPSLDAEEAASLNPLFASAPYAAQYKYLSAGDVYDEEVALNPEIAEFDENPFAAEYSVILRPEYVSADSVAMITSRIEGLNVVDEVISQTEAINTINNVLGKSALVLLLVGAVLLFISIVLIFNTVSLAIYSRRFIIHTMQLVGATRGFIRRPFVRASVVSGIISALVATILLYMLILYARSTGIEVFIIPTITDQLMIGLVLLLVGVLLCGTAAYIATTKYLKSTYDKLYH